MTDHNTAVTVSILIRITVKIAKPIPNRREKPAIKSIWNWLLRSLGKKYLAKAVLTAASQVAPASWQFLQHDNASTVVLVAFMLGQQAYSFWKGRK